MKLLITGSSGFIGSKLVEKLQNQNIEFDILKRTDKTNSARAGEVNVSWPDGILNLDLKPYSAIIHLAAAPATQGAETFLRENNLKPIEIFLKQIANTNPSCSFIFVTSQSAKAETESVYGRLKWEAEELIKKHTGKWTILRPGLVIGDGGKGLFNRLFSVVEKFPIIPLVGNGDQLLQPIGIKEVVDALLVAATSSEKHSNKDYPLTGHTISLKEFLIQSANVLGKKRIFVPIPLVVVNFGLSTLEKILPNPPITKTNLIGLLNLEVLNSADAADSLGLKIPSLTQTLEDALLLKDNSPLETEAIYFYKYLFAKTPSRILIERYVKAHTFCCFVKSPEQQINIGEICEKKLDPECIEFVTRSRKTLLTKKLTLLSYLAEIESSNYSIFINQKSNFILGFLLLGLAVLRTPWKMAKGKYLVWRYRLV